MSATASRVVAVGFVIGVIALVALGLGSNWTPTIVAGAGTTPITETVLTGEVDPDPDSDPEVVDQVMSPSGQACLDRISNATGHLDLCWQVWRIQDGDPQKDYYNLRLYGTASGSGSGIRWWALVADLVGEPGEQVFDGWPADTYEGPCTQQEVSVALAVPRPFVEVCGRTVGKYEQALTWAYKVTWQCVGCVLPDQSNREVTLFSSVGVPQGTVPTWTIGADFGQ